MQTAVRITLSSISPEPTYTGGPFVSGVAQLDTANPATTDWDTDYFVSCGAFGERADIVIGGNYGQLLDSEMEISIHDKWFAAFSAAGASLVGAVVEIGEATSSIDMDAAWTGTVADPTFQGMNVQMRVENILATRHKTIPARTITAQEFPGIPASAEGNPVPTIFGAVTGLTGTPLVSDRQYYDDACIVHGNPDVSEGSPRTTTIWVESGVHKGVMIDYHTPGISFTPSVSEFPSWCADLPSGNVYLEITDGTGSGQSRQILSGGNLHSYTNAEGATIWFLEIVFASPFDPLPENLASILRLYSQDLDGVILVGDEAVVSEVTGINDNETYPVLFVQGSNSLGVTADLSSQLASGDSIETIVYLQPSISETANVVDKDLATLTTYANSYSGEVICPASATIDQIAPWYKQRLTGICGFMKAETTTAHYNSSATTFRQYVSAMRISGTNDVTTLYDMPDPVDGFPPWILSGGTATNLLASPLVVTSRDISEYARIDTDVEPYNPQHGPIFEQALTSVTFTSGSATLTMTGLAEKAPSFIAGATDLTLCKIRPKGCPRGQWIGIASYVVSPGFPQYVNAITLSENWPYATFTTTDGIEVLPADQIFDVDVYEIGVGLVVGDLTAASEYRVSTSSGRKFSAAWPALPAGKSVGDPITLARDAVLDIYYRDLALPAGAVDFASFQALPADPIYSALTERVDSAERVASLCQQFNWVIGHDGDGRETAFAWLSRVGTTDYDLSIDTGDVVEGTLTGVAMTDILDLVNLPNVQWNWTQADEFRSQSNVVDVALDPLSINAGNYLQYITGFGDFSTALDVYTSLHKSYQLNTYQKSATIGMPDVGADASSVLWPLTGMSRFDWMASRKPLYQLVVPDTSAAASCIVGQRVRLRHKRYTAGAWVYGTVVEWSMDPMASKCSITVMGDPVPLDPDGNALYIDTIDPTETVPLYTDMADGTTEQYIDSTGA